MIDRRSASGKALRRKKIILICAAVLCAWLILLGVDCLAVGSGRMPLFCIPFQTADDGGSGAYLGLGYRFEVRGALEVEAGYRVKEAVFYLFGLRVADWEPGERDGAPLLQYYESMSDMTAALGFSLKLPTSIDEAFIRRSFHVIDGTLLLWFVNAEGEACSFAAALADETNGLVDYSPYVHSGPDERVTLKDGGTLDVLRGSGGYNGYWTENGVSYCVSGAPDIAALIAAAESMTAVEEWTEETLNAYYAPEIEYNSLAELEASLGLASDCPAEMPLGYALHRLYSIGSVIAVMEFRSASDTLLYYQSQGEAAYYFKHVGIPEGSKPFLTNYTLDSGVTIHMEGADSILYTWTVAVGSGENGENGRFLYSREGLSEEEMLLLAEAFYS